MGKLYSFLLFFLFSFTSFSQNNITIEGKILDKVNQLPMEAVTVYLTSVKDSTVIDYTISDKNGFFKMNTKKITKPVFLKVSYMGYATFKKEEQELVADKNYGVLYLSENANTLSEVVVVNEAPPIRIKKDTLEFNASSFKVRPDSNVETLLKQLPGVEIDADGKITVNGKEVNQILVNGKPFFDKDGKIALQSLPADIINKVQVSDTKTKKEELTKQASSSNNASINLTIDEDKNKGLFGKIMGGYGSDSRYESSLLINYFKSKQKISVLASSNNINSTGFSMDEIFDNMGGGRNASFSYNSDGTFGINGNTFGGGKGIIQSSMVGINYADEWFKKLDANGSYFFTNSNAENTRKVNQVSFLPTGDFATASNTNSNIENYGNNLNLDFEYKIDSTATIQFSPKLSIGNRKSYVNSAETSTDENNALLNENNAVNNQDANSSKFENRLNFNKAFKKKGRYLNVNFESENADVNTNILNKSITTFYQDAKPDDIRNQLTDNEVLKNSYSSEIEYLEPINDSLKLKLGAYFRNEKSSDDNNAFNYDPANEDYTIKNEFLTNFLSSTINLVTPKAGIAIDKSKYSLGIDLGVTASSFDNYSLYLNKPTNLNKDYVFPFANVNANYKFSKSSSFYLQYNYTVDFPKAFQIMPVFNLANPLNTIIGNKDIDLIENHNLYLGFNNYDYATQSGYYLYGGGGYYDNQVVSFVLYDENRKATTTYKNVAGTYNSFFGGRWNKSIKKEANNYKFGVGGWGSYNLSKGFTEGEMFEANTFEITPSVNFTYEYGEVFTINPTYNFTYNETRYTNYSINSASNFVHKLNIQTTNYWPKNWVFGNDFGYTYNSNISPGFQKNFFLWNTSLSYNFFNKQFTAKVKVYDILDQNQSATRTISPTYILDEENTVLKRYVMFSLSYKLEKFGAKEKENKRSRWMF